MNTTMMRNKRRYTAPEMEISYFEAMDIVTASTKEKELDVFKMGETAPSVVPQSGDSSSPWDNETGLG